MLLAITKYFHPKETVHGDYVTSLSNRNSVPANGNQKFGELKVSGKGFNINYLTISFDDTKPDLDRTLVTVQRYKSDFPIIDKATLREIANPRSKTNPFYIMNFNTRKGSLQVVPDNGLEVILESKVSIDPNDIEFTFKGYRYIIIGDKK